MTLHASYGDNAAALVNPLDLHSMLRNKSAIVEGGVLSLANANLGFEQSITIDMKQWLPHCARVLHISPDPKDYVLVPVVTILSDLPNRNGVGFPLAELVAWCPERGMQSYKTFTGQPVYLEHANTNLVDARGVILDCALRKLKGYGNGRIWKVVELLAVDRSKDIETATRILTRKINSYSMGAWVTGYRCGYCNADAGKCGHINLKRPVDLYVHQGKLVFRHALGINGFETSVKKYGALLQ